MLAFLVFIRIWPFLLGAVTQNTERLQLVAK